MASIEETIKEMARAARRAGRIMGRCPSAPKDRALLTLADLILAEAGTLKAANREDIAAARQRGLPAPMIDRLTLTDATLTAMAHGVREVAGLADPVGSLGPARVRPNGLQIARMRIPLGVIGIIYESRPNVTVDAAALCLKAGNAVILRGGSEALASNRALAEVVGRALAQSGLPQAAVQVVPVADRAAVTALLQQEEDVDLIIPRGGEELIRFVVAHSRIPVLKHYKGVCHVYVDEGADLDMAEAVCFNAKVQRPGVCNAMETLLVHRADGGPVPAGHGRALCRGRGRAARVPRDASARARRRAGHGGGLVGRVPGPDPGRAGGGRSGRGDRAHRPRTARATPRPSSRATTGGPGASCARWTRRSCWSTPPPASTTAAQFGLGAEIGISTSKLHAFGPMGLEELTTTKFVVYGDGQTREP